MKFKELTLTNFGPFVKPTRLSLSKLHGLVWLTGDNLTQPRLGANGVGKSKLLEAVYWCMYGKTSRGLKGTGVRAWGAKGACSVRLTIDDYEIHRQASPNKLELDGKPADQKEVDEALGISADEFLHSVYFAQFSSSFLDLTPAKQLELYSQVMDLAVWEQASDNASKATKETEANIVNTDRELAHLQGKAETLQLMREQAVDLAGKWGKQQRVKAAELAKELKEAEAWLERIKGTGVSAGDSQRVKQLDREEREAYNALMAMQRTVSELNKRRDGLLHAPTICPECGQKVSKEHTRQKLASISKQLKEYTENAKLLEARHKKLSTTFSQLRKKVEERKEAQGNTIAAQREVDKCAHELARLRAEKNPHRAQAESAQEELTAIKNDISRREVALNKARELVEQQRYWIKGFRDLRLWVIDESLTQLEIEVNSTLHEIGLEGWSMQFDVERETKSGGVSRGFTIMVTSPTNEDAVPWEAWSGGESQRLRLACSMGISNLICARRGVRPSIEFWDEPSTWLSEEGIEDMLGILEYRAQQRAVVIADHRALGSGNFDAVLKVVKEDDGSYLIGG